MDHDRFDEDRAAILARRQRLIALALGGLAAGCAMEDGGGEEGITTTSASSPSTTDMSESETAEMSSSSMGATTGPTACLSVDVPSVNECEPFLQDCPEGEKCVPYGSTGLNWDSNKCVEIQGPGEVGDACVYGGTFEATDDCGPDSHCWNVHEDEGECVPFCAGTLDAPNCPNGSECLVANDASIALCLDTCDPLAQDCDEGLGCSWTGSSFACLVTTQDTALTEPCGFANDCTPGAVCVAAEFALPACEWSACCTDFCALDDPEACADPLLECTGLFAEGEAPPGYDNVGICVEAGACEGGEPGCLEHARIDEVER